MALDSLGCEFGVPPVLAPLQTMVWQLAAQQVRQMERIAGEQRAVTRESARAVRHRAHEMGLPVLGGGK